MPICPLCREEKTPTEFRDSHIIPEFLYEELYDKQHSLMAVATAMPALPQRRHKGIYQKDFLCADCEGQLGKHEDYLAKRLKSKVSVVPSPDATRFSGFDYRQMKLFQMSVLWRTSASTRAEFGGVVLGPRQETLRAMVANDDPGTWSDFPCVLVANPSMQARFGRQLIVTGAMARDHDAQRVAVFYFGGFFWWFFVSSRAARSERAPFFLREDGILSIIRSDDPPWPWLA
ncbi:MAG: hypothetical protein EPN53_14620 [Acidobacteria bacterium]|nr:MAG: hypothetical protein EPN53_14620 [Acidobacteriota bacterium]